MSSKVSSLDDRREREAEEKLVWVCLRPIADPDGATRECGNKLFYVHIDAGIECSNCGWIDKSWMESIDG